MPEKSSYVEPDPIEGAIVATPASEPYPERQCRADHYFDVHLQGQRKWYGTRASKNKKISNILAILVMASGACTTLIQLFGDRPAVPVTTAILGVVVVLAKGLERIGRYGETWVGYRKASEAMKHEYRLYINNAGDYADAIDEEEAYRWLVDRVEQVIGEEESQFWLARSKSEKRALPEEVMKPADP